MKKKKMLLIICIIAAIISISTVSIISVNAETPTPSLTIASNTLELKNAVFMNFKVSAKNISDTSSVKLLVWEEIPSEYTMESAPLAISSIRTEDSTGYLVFQYDNLSAKDMTKFIYVCAYADIDGTAVYSKPVKFSILQYAQTVLNSEASSEELKTLVSNMLDYGAMAQIYFDHNTELLATDTIAKIKVVNGVHADGFKTGYYKAGTSVTLTANAAEDGYVFSHWENSSGNVVGTESTLTISKCVSETYTAMYRNATSSIQYRYRDKQYTTSTTELEEPWILYDTVTETEHGATVKVYLKEDEAIDTNEYCVHYKTSVCKYMHPTNSTYKWVNSSSSDHNYYYTYGDTKYWHYDDYYCYSCCHVSAKITATEYYYYSWSEWSEWSDTPITATSNREVEVRGVFTITYDANGGTNPPVAQSKAFGENIIITSSVPTRDGYTFQGWSTTSNGSVEYNSGDSYSVDNNVTLYAVWEANTYTITYNANGGTNAPQTQTKVHGIDLKLSNSIPTREGYTFKGWATSANGSVEYSMGDTFSKNENTILYAVWKIEQTVTVIASGSCGNDLIWSLSEEGTLIISGNGTMTDWSETTYTSAPWYKYQYDIKNVIISDGVKSIGKYAFYRYYYIKNVTFGNTVERIGKYSFRQTAVVSLIFPQSLKYIETDAFGMCFKLTNITFNSGVYIYNDAFNTCQCIQNVYVPSIDMWCQMSFNGVDSNPITASNSNAILYINSEIAEDIVIPSSVEKIPASAFAGYLRLNSIVILEGVTSIGNYAFSECKDLVSVDIPNSVVTIGNYAFYKCENLTNVKISEDSLLEYIGDNSFYDCYRLNSIVIPNNVISIGSYAFESSSGLESVAIPQSVKSIGYRAFACYNLSEVVFEKTTGWKVSTTYTGGTNEITIDVAKSSTNATYFKETYCEYYWLSE